MNNRENLLRVIVVALLVYSIAHLSAERTKLYSQEQELQRMSSRLMSLEEKRQELRARAASRNSDEELKRQAWERLGMVMPDEIIFYFTDREGQ